MGPTATTSSPATRQRVRVRTATADLFVVPTDGTSVRLTVLTIEPSFVHRRVGLGLKQNMYSQIVWKKSTA